VLLKLLALPVIETWIIQPVA